MVSSKATSGGSAAAPTAAANGESVQPAEDFALDLDELELQAAADAVAAAAFPGENPLAICTHEGTEFMQRLQMGPFCESLRAGNGSQILHSQYTELQRALQSDGELRGHVDRFSPTTREVTVTLGLPLIGTQGPSLQIQTTVSLDCCMFCSVGPGGWDRGAWRPQPCAFGPQPGGAIAVPIQSLSARLAREGDSKTRIIDFTLGCITAKGGDAIEPLFRFITGRTLYGTTSGLVLELHLNPPLPFLSLTNAVARCVMVSVDGHDRLGIPPGRRVMQGVPCVGMLERVHADGIWRVAGVTLPHETDSEPRGLPLLPLDDGPSTASSRKNRKRRPNRPPPGWVPKPDPVRPAAKPRRS